MNQPIVFQVDKLFAKDSYDFTKMSLSDLYQAYGGITLIDPPHSRELEVAFRKEIQRRRDDRPRYMGAYKIEVITPERHVYIYSNMTEEALYAFDLYEVARMAYPESVTVLVSYFEGGKRSLKAVGTGKYEGNLYAEKDAAALFMATEDDDQLTKQICTGIYPTQSK